MPALRGGEKGQKGSRKAGKDAAIAFARWNLASARLSVRVVHSKSGLHRRVACFSFDPFVGRSILLRGKRNFLLLKSSTRVYESLTSSGIHQRIESRAYSNSPTIWFNLSHGQKSLARFQRCFEGITNIFHNNLAPLQRGKRCELFFPTRKIYEKLKKK